LYFVICSGGSFGGFQSNRTVPPLVTVISS